ncbi:MAG: hypothetical protein BWY59_02094 [Verrucomicrobia bacterium ADurb.Bin345]|nr:MAG: hypothetical protein BWY59_02094 [Verrucomicrobia bacterium ADurb.Bin345]
MAWRIDKQLVRAELDNRTKGRVVGTLWFEGRVEPVTLDLKGNPWRDLAGHRIVATNPSPEPGKLDGFAEHQVGVVGDITASRKVRVPDCPMEEFIASYKTDRKFTFHMANALYLEWYSEQNGRVVIESSDYKLELDGLPAWEMTDEDERERQSASSEALHNFMDLAVESLAQSREAHDDSDDQPTSRVEEEADAEAARMDLLLDRVGARLEREGREESDFERIFDEEKERLRKERGEPEPEPLTPEQEAEREAWIEEMNAVAEEALEEMEAGGGFDEWENHPLVETCSDLASRLYHDVKDHAWVAESASHEHPLNEIVDGVQIASAKLAGALNGSVRDEEWPPDPLFAGDTLVRLKKARRYLRDALAGLDSADEQRLAEPEWRSQARIEVNAIVAHVEALIKEVRARLE